jgi:AraC-like DNA-binding protein
VRLAELAEVAGMGPFALTRCFRRVVGVPPYAYLELLRVERAKELLRGGTAITEVAHVTGFSDQSHLTRHFRRVVGVPPGRYARAHAAGRARRAA